MSYGIVAIGRNEGERLRTCLAAAVATEAAAVVYVDSGSTDGSRELAGSMNVDVVELDLARPFTAARARNEGFARLLERVPNVGFVQFLDGDCELRPGWCDRAIDELNTRLQAAVVCGRRRERFPDATVWNKLCDIEWDTPVGLAKSCGGDAMFRVAAFAAAGGYDAGVIAGEEPELCVRLRAAGWEVWRVDAEMTLHDAAITRVSQWWKRNVRAGHAYAEGNARHGAAPERFAAQQVRSNRVWGTAALLPLAWPLHAILAMKIARGAKARRRLSTVDALKYGLAVAAGKLPQMLGQRKYAADKKAGRRAAIIEYKSPAA